MSAWANIDGTWRKGQMWLNVAGTWRKVTPWQNVGGVWKKADTLSTDMAVTAAPDNVSGAVSRPGGAAVNTNETTAVTVVGGVAPFTYAWASGEGTMAATAPSSATTRFSATLGAGDSTSDTFVCTVTDARGQTALSNSVFASVYNYGRSLDGPIP